MKIEAYGVKGMKSTPWRKTFKTAEALNLWVEKHSAEVHGVRGVVELRDEFDSLGNRIGQPDADFAWRREEA